MGCSTIDNRLQNIYIPSNPNHKIENREIMVPEEGEANEFYILFNRSVC